jgi:hypothetical protein
MISTGDCIVNQVWVWMFFLINPTLTQFCVCSGISVAVAGYSFIIPSFGHDAAKTRHWLDVTVLSCVILISIYMSVAGLNISNNLQAMYALENGGADIMSAAAFSTGVVRIAGETVMFWMFMSFGLMVSILNGYYPFLSSRVEALQGK